ncbi:rCG34434 [Rattus norvegicus]|uniref:RCG34434 n=1 Tax=Rattus norvegicus TaxID=10116 RepID=A6HCV8_RAT|nr:rCG34434 [Rattus norvegicus]
MTGFGCPLFSNKMF